MALPDQAHPAGGAALEFWFDFGSNYSYLSLMRIEKEAARYGVGLAWKPFLLGPIFRALGWENSPFVMQKEKGCYVWRDMARQCRKYDLPWRRPATFPRGSVLAHRVALAGANEAWLPEFCRRIMLLNFAEDRDFDTPELVGEVLQALGLPAGKIVEAAQSDEIKRGLRRQTEEARARGVFGAPTFFARGEMFWGNDRLEDALACASQPLQQQER
jgi:2-hydroxychromene-2-carboxylate isomerase